MPLLSERRELQAALQRLVDVGLLLQTRPAYGHLIRYLASVKHEFDDSCWHESEVCRVMRDRTELGYEDEDQLRAWLEAAGVMWDERMLDLAIANLERVGKVGARLETPRPDTWEGPGPRLTWVVDPPIHQA